MNWCKSVIYRYIIHNQFRLACSIFFFTICWYELKINFYDGKTKLVLFRSLIYIYLCNGIGLGHPLNHRKSITVFHLGMPGTLGSRPSIPLFLYHQLRKTENR